MNNLKIFNKEEFGQVRVLSIKGDPWFVGKDVAVALGYANSKDAIASHVDSEDKEIFQRSENATFEIPNRGLTIINESGLYSLILSSKLPTAKQFKRWVTSEVLPTIRKTGTYIKDKKPSLASLNATAKLLKETYDEAGVDKKFTLLAIVDLYNDKADLQLTAPMEVSKDEVAFDKSQIAKRLGLLSSSGKPHAHLVGAIISTMKLTDNQKIITPFTKNGHNDFFEKYKLSVVEDIRDYIEERRHPAKIEIGGKSYSVQYGEDFPNQTAS